MRRITILLATVAAFCLVPAAQAFAASHLHVNITATGGASGEVSSVGGFFGGGAYEGTPAIECSGPPASGVCENEMQLLENEEESFGYVQANPSVGSAIVGWTVNEGEFAAGCGSGSGFCIVKAFEGEPAAVTAEFGPGMPLTITTAGSGEGTVETGDFPASIVCGSEGSKCSHFYFEGAEVELRVYPEPGNEFVGWSTIAGSPGECTGTALECIVTMSEPVELTATFCPEGEPGCAESGPAGPPLTLNIEEGEGTVVSNPAGLSCSGSAPHGCTTEEIEEGSVTLTASPAPGYLFKSWKKCDSGGVNGRQCTINLNSAKEVGAKFVKVWSLDASKAGSGQGKIQTSPGGILCLYNCAGAEAAFKEGSVTVKQAAAKHNHFVQWLGDCTGSEPTCTVSMTADHEVEAEFAPDTQYTLSYSAEGGGQGSVKSKPSGLLCGYTCGSQTASFYSGENVEIEVKLNKGTTKLTWSTGAGTCTGSTEAAVSTCTVPMSSAKSLVADFS